MKVDRETCIGCGACVGMCPVNAISIVDDNDFKIVTFVTYPATNKSFDECNSLLRKLLYEIAIFIRGNEEYKDLSIKVISGYRTTGNSKSQHNIGEAMDLQAINRTDANNNQPAKQREKNKDLFSIVSRFIEKGKADQLIWELHDENEDSRTSNPNTIHVSCKPQISKNRRNLLFGRINNKGKFISIKDPNKQHTLYLAEVNNVKSYKP